MYRHRDRAARGRLMTLWRGNRTMDSHGDLRDLRQIVNCVNIGRLSVLRSRSDEDAINADHKSTHLDRS